MKNKRLQKQDRCIYQKKKVSLVELNWSLDRGEDKIFKTEDKTKKISQKAL